MKQLYLLLSLTCFSFQLFSQNSIEASVYFETAKHNLTSQSIQTLDHFIKGHTNLDDYAIEIMAHTDSRGSISYNQGLANRRANSVQSYLAQRGIIIQKVTVNSYGESQPSFSNATKLGRSQNRRVDIILKPIKFNNINDVFSKLTKDKEQTFKISSNKLEIIKGKQGTILSISPNNFEFEDGSGMPDGEIEIQLKEAYSYGDLMAMKLTTTSDDELLETGGSLEITASSNGKPLKIKTDKSIGLKMPSANNIQNDMQIFIADAPTDDKFVNWKSTNEPFKVEKNNTKVKSAEMPDGKKPKVLPVVLDKDGEINRSATQNLLKLSNYKEGNEDYVPYHNSLEGEPIFLGYIPLSLYKEWETLEEEMPKFHLEEPTFSQVEPKKPKREDIQYHPSRRTKLKLGQKGIEAKKEEIFQRKLKSFEKKLERYQKNKTNYEKRLAQYELEYAQFEIESIKDWEKKKRQLEARIAEVMVYDKKQQEAQMWAKSKEQRLLDIEEKIENNTELEDFEIQYYVGQITTLGLINCDKFRIFNGNRMPIVVQKTLNGAIIYVLIKRFKTMIGAPEKGIGYETQLLPKGLKATVIGFSTNNGEVLLGKQEIRTGSQEPIQLDYQPVTLAALKVELEKY